MASEIFIPMIKWSDYTTLNCARKWCQKLHAFLFPATCTFWKMCIKFILTYLTLLLLNINGIMLFGNYLVREKGKRLFCTFMTKRMYMLLNQYMDLLTWKKFSFEAISDWCTLPKAHWSGILDKFYLITKTFKKILSRT